MIHKGVAYRTTLPTSTVTALAAQAGGAHFGMVNLANVGPSFGCLGSELWPRGRYDNDCRHRYFLGVFFMIASITFFRSSSEVRTAEVGGASAVISRSAQ
jgi:hypothetical protein